MQSHRPGELFCPSADCNRSRNAARSRPFSRQDNLDDHVKRVHTVLPPAAGRAEEPLIAQSSLRKQKRKRLDDSIDQKSEDLASRVRELEERLADRNQELLQKDEEIKWLKQLVDKLTAGSNLL